MKALKVLKTCTLLFPVYTLLFFALTFPWLNAFNTSFMCDTGDGYNNVWNLWWIHKALSHDGILHFYKIWFTPYLHAPLGVSLLAHTLNPFNGIMAHFLQNAGLSLVQAHNSMITFSFAMAGVTAYWLAFHITQNKWASFIAGYLFAFSSFHFAQAEGHMQMVIIEWIPLAMLTAFRFFEAPSHKRALAFTGAMTLIVLSDYYFYLYIIMGILFYMGVMAREQNISYFKYFKNFITTHAGPSATLIVSGLFTHAQAPIHLVLSGRGDPWLGAHDAKEYAADPFAYFIPGGHWRFFELSRFYWSKLPGNIHESSIHLGVILCLFLFWMWKKRKQFEFRYFDLCVFMSAAFAVLSLGPVLHLWGKIIRGVYLPYAVTPVLFPPISLSGCPVRMSVMVSLFTGILVGSGFVKIFKKSGLPKRAFLILCAAGVITELLPKPMPEAPNPQPPFVQFLKTQPKDGALYDAVYGGRDTSMFFQTQHEIPIAEGVASRMPLSRWQNIEEIHNYVNSGNFQALCLLKSVRYIAVPANLSLGGTNSSELESHAKIFEDTQAKVYDLKKLYPCKPLEGIPI